MRRSHLQLAFLVAAHAVAVSAAARADVAPTVDVKPPARTANEWLDEAWRLRKEKKWDAARSALDEARRAGMATQRVEIELGYLELEAGRPAQAKTHFAAVEKGPDAALAKQAHAQASFLPSHFWGELYADTVTWYRFYPQGDPSRSWDLVPTLRLRALYRPTLNVDFNLYLFGQITRDAQSRDRQGLGTAVIYADNYALLGAGVLLGLWNRRVALFAQVGPAFNLLDDGNPRVTYDLRAGIIATLASAGCNPPRDSAPRRTLFCGELYSEAVYLNRFDNNLIAFVRPRVGMTVLRTGPVAWQPMLEARLAKDLDNYSWNNFAELGLAHRWRVLGPFAFDAIVGVHAGTLFGLNHAYPAGSPQQDVLPMNLKYVEARLLLVTYVTTDAFKR